MTSNKKGDLERWQPFHNDSDRRTRHATSEQGGEKKRDATITSRMTEFFIPYKLLRPLNNIPLVAGAKWRANLYRIDYDKNISSWSWEMTSIAFHEHEMFGVLLFE